MIREFGYHDLIFLVKGMQWTVTLSLIAFIGGAVGGITVALCRTSTARWLQRLTAGYIEIFQGTPLLMQLFLVFYGLPVMGFNVNAWTAASLCLTLHASAFLGEIWRGCIQALPKGQIEAASALGLGYWSRMFDVVLPQALQISLAPTLGFLVQLIKGTSLTAIIGFVELSRSAQIVSSTTYKPLFAYGAAAILYFVICYPLSFWSSSLEKRFGA